MPIELYTGLPGNGKTAFMMRQLIAESAKAERPLVESGIDGIAPGLAMHLADPRNWNEVDPDAPAICNCTAAEGMHGHFIPDGSKIFVDEAWKWFGHLHDASRQSTPKHVLQLAEHRHRGIDFVFTTQAPNQLYPFVRALISTHTHCLRRYGTSFVDLFTWGELNEDVKSTTKRENATRETTTLPVEVFSKYKSATLHTIKRKLPWKIVAFPAIAIAAIVVGWFAYQALKPEHLVGDIPVTGAIAGEAGKAPGSANPEKKQSVPATPEAYARMHAPMIVGQPWTAPAFLDRKVTADPLIFCAISHAGEDANGEWVDENRCHCITEQGSQLEQIPDAQCRRIARNGMDYNPYKEKTRQPASRQDRGPQRGPETLHASSAQGAGSADWEGQQARYGQMRQQAIPEDPGFEGDG